MDLKELGAALLRRWYLTIATVVLAAIAGFGVAQIVGANYTAVATAALIPPQSTVENAARTAVYAPPNPLLYLNGLSQSRDVVARAMSSQQMAEELANRVPGATPNSTGDPTSSAPIIVMTVEAKSEAGALTGLGLLRERLPNTLASLQQQVGVAQNNFITALPLTTDDEPKTDRKAQIQATIVVFATVLVVGLLVLAYVDGSAQAGRRRGSRGRTESAAASPPPEGESDTLHTVGVSGDRKVQGRSGGDGGRTSRDASSPSAVEDLGSAQR